MAPTKPTLSRSRAELDRPLARRIGVRIREERLKAGLTQAGLADGRYTKAYISALENGLVKPSMAALNFLADRLGIPATRFLEDHGPAWTRLEADLRLAAGEWQAAADGYADLLDADPSPTFRPELLRGLAEALCRLERPQEALRAAAEARTTFIALDRRADAALAAYWESFALYELEQGDEAKLVLQRVLDEVAAGLEVEPDLTVRALIALAMNESRDDEPERALAHLERARSLVPLLDSRRRATFLFSLALNYRELGDLEGAMTSGTQALAQFRAASAGYEVAALENELALVHLGLGNVGRAREHAKSARDGFERLDNERYLAHVTDTESQIALAAGHPDEALERGAEAIRLADATGNRKARLSACLSIARARRAAGDLAGASQILEEAAESARAIGRRAQLQAVLGEWADVRAELGDLEGAYRLSREALSAGRG
ncbi:MAG: helix-turn-helix domain-containing protein [Candidatus Limnocylindrales bacterium]